MNHHYRYIINTRTFGFRVFLQLCLKLGCWEWTQRLR